LKKAEESAKKLPGIGIVGLGTVIAAGEFLCSGQVYLATLLTTLQKSRDTARLWGLLLTYCVVFLIPSIMPSLIVIKGRNVLGVPA